MKSETEAEVEFLELLISLCRTARDPRRRKNRIEMSVPAARYEMQFGERVRELKEDSGLAELKKAIGQ